MAKRPKWERRYIRCQHQNRLRYWRWLWRNF